VKDFYSLALPFAREEKVRPPFSHARHRPSNPTFPSFEERYLLKPACLAVYPMYKGLAQLVGMAKLEGPQTIAAHSSATRRIRELRLFLHSL